MSDSLGLSIGMTNLVAARIGRPPVMRRSVLTLFDDRAPEVGVPGVSSNPNLQPTRHGAERFRGTGRRPSAAGRRRRLAAPRGAGAGRSPRRDGTHGRRRCTRSRSRYPRTGDPQPSARCGERCAPSRALRRAVCPRRSSRTRSRRCQRCRPRRGCRPTASSCCAISAAAAPASRWPTPARTSTPIGETVRYPDFSGDQIDQALLNHVLAGIAQANDSDPAGTAAVGSLARLRNESRQAKERLSAETATVIPADLPGFNSDVRVTRTELEQLIAEPLARSTRHRRRNPAAQQHSRRERLRGGNRRRRGEHPAGHPAAVDAVARPRRHDTAVATQRGGGRRAGGRYRVDGRRTHRDGGAPPTRRRAWPRRDGRPAPPGWRPPSRPPTVRRRRRSARWRGRRTILPAVSPCRTPARTTPSSKALPPPGHRWSSPMKRRATRPSRGRCRGTSVRRSCSGRPRPPHCWPSAGSRSP